MTQEHRGNDIVIPPSFFAVVVAALLASVPSTASAQLYKCAVNGSVTYQNTPCPPGEARPPPSVDQLNAERRRKLTQNGKAATGAADERSARPLAAETGKPGASEVERRRQGTDKPMPPGARFSCDGRTHCSQMTSCAEATYFLAHCPGVKMDGDRNGIPCEQQWCGR